MEALGRGLRAHAAVGALPCCSCAQAGLRAVSARRSATRAHRGRQAQVVALGDLQPAGISLRVRQRTGQPIADDADSTVAGEKIGRAVNAFKEAFKEGRNK